MEKVRDPDSKIQDSLYNKIVQKGTVHFCTSYSSKTLSINTDSGVINATTYAYSYSEIIGPVKKGFKASITLKEEQVSGGIRNLKIYVARGSEPFALKATSTNTASVSYTIDY